MKARSVFIHSGAVTPIKFDLIRLRKDNAIDCQFVAGPPTMLVSRRPFGDPPDIKTLRACANDTGNINGIESLPQLIKGPQVAAGQLSVAMWKSLQTFARSPKHSMAALGILFSALIVILFLVDLRTRYHNAIDAAKNEALKDAAILSDNTALTFETVDRVLREAELIRLGGFTGNYATSDAMNAALRHVVQTSPFVVAVGWTNASGDLLAHSYEKPPPRANIADLPHFTAQRDGGADRLFIAEPFSSSAGDRWLTAASRRLNNPDGSLAGVVTAPLDPSYFNRTFRSFNLSNGGAILLLHRSGRLLAREPVVKSAIGKSFAAGPLLTEYIPRSDAGSYETLSVVDGTARIVGYKAVPGLPLVLLVSYTRAAVLAPWYQHLYQFGLLLILIVVLILAGTFVLVRQASNLAEQTAVVEATNTRFDAALSNMSQGLCLFDANKNLVIANSRFREMYGLPEEAVRPGTPLSQILEHHAERGEKSDLSVEEHVQTMPAELNQVFSLADGRVISIKRTPMPNGGWVATYDDVTERKQSETALLKSKAMLHSTLAALSEGVVVRDANGRIISCNPAAERILGIRPGDLSDATSVVSRRQTIHEDGRDFPEIEHPAMMALATGAPQHDVIMGLRSDTGSITWISINSVPIYTDGKTEPTSVVTSFSDITARKQAQEVLREAISASPDALVIYDERDRLVTCNEAYRQIYAESAASIYPGALFEDVLLCGLENNQYPEAGETAAQRSAWLAERMRLHRAPSTDAIQRLSNGRWIQLRERRTASGLTVGFRIDVTELHNKTAKLQAVIDNFPGGLSFLDADYNMVACNQTFRTLLDLPEDLFQDGLPSLEMVLRANAARGEYGPGDSDEQVRARMELARKGEAHLFERTRPDGTVLEVRGTPIKGGGFITTYMDVTARHATEKQLSDSEQRAQEKSATLELTLAHMSQGLSMFDASGQLMVWNARYAKMYCLSPDLLKQGVTVSAIGEHMSRTGYLGTDEPDWRQKLADKSSFAATLRFNDGRVIRIVRTPIEDSGWVATHEDITEQMRSEASLFQQSAELARINMQFDAALSNMTQGLCMFDGQKGLAVWNQRYAGLYQLPPDLLKVGTPHDAIIADRIFRGILKGETSDSAAKAKIAALGQLPKNTTSSRVDEFADGRLMLVTRLPTADGGWLATHEDITERRRAEAEIIHLARHDVLTGLANRAEFNAKLEEASKRLKRNGGAVTVMMLDLDKFKAVNDTLGHPAGDQLLVEVARRLKSSVRETDVLARLGGDEFAIIQEGGPNQHEGAIALALRIINAIAQPFDLNGHTARVGTSIGIVLAPEHDVEPEELLKKADLALYNVKANGRNDFRVFQSEMLEVAHTQESAESELRDAIARDEFELHYQPVVDIKTRQLCGVEALVRWRHPTKGLIGPDQFIPLAESTGLIVPLGEWILHQACADAASWPAHVKVAINVSAVQFKKGNLFDVILCTLVETGLAPERLELEITETALLENQDAHLAAIRQLKNLGISLALDDFGTGYSALNYLTNFPFDKIKIDQSFTQGALNRRECAAVVSSVLALAQGLGIATTAEGVETQAQFEYMREAGVDLVQGYLYGRPVPISKLDLHNATLPREMVA
jgi:diguanylate cyclase (GGDEF)-like protein/PAS domain S-box-containing protein